MMKKLISLLLIPTLLFAADNEIHVDQSGATANIDLEQLGSGNIIGSTTLIHMYLIICGKKQCRY